MKPTRKLLLGICLLTFASLANALQVQFAQHNVTSASGEVSTMITDGSSTLGSPTTAIFDWDGTVLSSSGLYSAESNIPGLPMAKLFADQIMDLAIDTSTGTASATSYSCTEGTFGGSAGVHLCGNYNFGGDFSNDSAVSWGPGTAASRTIGGDDTAIGPQRTIAAYDFGYFDATVITAYSEEYGGFLDWATIVVGNGIGLGTAGGEWMCFRQEYALGDGPTLPTCEQAVENAIGAPIPVPPAVWLFGSALGALAWKRRNSN